MNGFLHVQATHGEIESTSYKGCAAAGKSGNGVSTPFSCFALKMSSKLFQNGCFFERVPTPVSRTASLPVTHEI